MTTELQNYGETTATMELQKQKPTPPLRPNPKMTLEQYIDFFDSQKQSVLTVNHLKQVTSMHGFKLIQRIPKDELMEAVKSINLIEPARSTLNNDDVSSCAFITLQDAINDLSSLKWQECCISSVQTLNTVNNHHLALTTTAATVASISSTKSKSKSKRDSSSPAAVTKPPGMEAKFGGVDGDVCRYIVAAPPPAHGGKMNESVIMPKRRKMKSIASFIS